MPTDTASILQSPLSSHLTDFLARVRVVMVNTTLPANIGSAARAMHTMGLSQLVVVDPKHPLDDDAYAHAAGASAILDQLHIVPTLEAAIGDCQWVLASSSRQRHLPKPVLTPRQAATAMLHQYSQYPTFSNEQHLTNEASSQTTNKPLVNDWQIALIFGREDRGLTNQELQLADYHVQIPANPKYGVLNVAAAVQVIASVFYESAVEHFDNTDINQTPADEALAITLRQHWDEPPITQVQKQQLTARLLALLNQTHLYHPEQSKLMPQRVNRLLGRLQLDIKEYQLLQALIAKLLQQ